MIAYTLLLLAATPLFALPVTENTQQQSVHQTPVQTPVEHHQKFPNLVPSVYSVSEYYSPKGKSAVVQIPIEPDALVIPYTNKYSFYPTVGTRTPVPTQYSAGQYQVSYAPEPFLVVPFPNIPKSAPLPYVSDIYNYYQAPRLLYYLPKSYYNQQQQQQQYQVQAPVQQLQHQQAVQQAVAEKSVHQQTPQVHQVVPQETVVPVEGVQPHQIQTQ